MTGRPADAQPTLVLRASSPRAIIQRHLAHLRGRFEAAGWRVVSGGEQPGAVPGAVAIVDDRWLEPLPEQLDALAAGGARPRRAEGAAPRVAPATRSEYERLAVGRVRRGGPRSIGGAWSGIAVAPAGAAADLLRLGWPPAAGEALLVPWVRMFRYHDPAAHARLELDAFIPDAARTILDVGCGAGLLGARHRRRGRTVIGVEPDWELVRLAARRLDAVIPAGASDAFPALAARFDCVVFADVLEHMADPAAALGAASRLLTSGGTIVASLPNAAWLPVLSALAAGRWDPTVAGVQARDHLFFTTAASFGAIAAEAGLEVVRSHPLPAPATRSQRLWARALAAVTGASRRTSWLRSSLPSCDADDRPVRRPRDLPVVPARRGGGQQRACGGARVCPLLGGDRRRPLRGSCRGREARGVPPGPADHPGQPRLRRRHQRRRRRQSG
jgi:SAM-dependent methyltransferase